MFRHIHDFETIFRGERDRTLQVLESIPDSAADQAVAEGHRNLRRMAWHLTETVAEMPSNMGVKVEGLPGEPYKTPPPGTMAEIAATYRRVTDSLLAEVVKLNDMALAMSYPFYGMTWTGALALHILINHEVHHRGQMTVLMRQAGLKVPDIYGPALEGWAAYGMQPPAV